MLIHRSNARQYLWSRSFWGVNNNNRNGFNVNPSNGLNNNNVNNDFGVAPALAGCMCFTEYIRGIKGMSIPFYGLYSYRQKPALRRRDIFSF